MPKNACLRSRYAKYCQGKCKCFENGKQEKDATLCNWGTLNLFSNTIHSMAEVSVLLPVRNGEASIHKALDSLWQQSFREFEVVLVDDGSSDATAAIVQACKDPRLKVIHRPPQGIAAALNEGLKHCGAPLVARMDADDTVHPERLEKQWEYFRRHPATDVLACRVEFGGDAQISKGYALYVEAINALLTHEQMWRRRFWDAPLAHPSVMYRKQVVLDAGGYSQQAVPEDYELWLRLFAAGYRFAKLPETLLCWNDHENRLSRTHPNYDKKAFWSLKAKYFSRWLKAEYGSVPPNIYLWGETVKKQRSRYLLQEGITIAGRIHSTAEPGSRDWIPYTAVPDLKNSLILVYVSDRLGQKQIMAFLQEHGFTEGESYFLMV